MLLAPEVLALRPHPVDAATNGCYGVLGCHIASTWITLVFRIRLAIRSQTNDVKERFNLIAPWLVHNHGPGGIKLVILFRHRSHHSPGEFRGRIDLPGDSPCDHARVIAVTAD